MEQNQEDTTNNVEPATGGIEEPSAMTEEITDVPASPAEPIDMQSKETKKPKLSKKSKILICLLTIVLLAIVGILIWYFVFRTSDEPQYDQANSESAPEQISKFALQGNELSDFDLAFLKMNSNPENIVYSPLSIKYALSMLADGSDGNTKNQITNLLGNYQPKAYLNNANRSLANAMFVRTGSVFSGLIKDSYTNDLKMKYGANVIYDSFESPDSANSWVSDETLGIINNLFNEDNFNTEKDFALINALAIDMEWNNQIQCTWDYYRASFSSDNDGLTCKRYDIRYNHENYHEKVDIIDVDEKGFSKLLFNNDKEIPAAEIGASANRYDIIKELGEDYIRETVQAEHEKWLQEGNKDDENNPFNIDNYMETLKENYGRLDESTDFMFYDSDTEKVFAKDLRKYDGSTLEYIGIMPKTSELNDYIKTLDAKSITSIINNLRTSSDVNSYKDGVVTKIYGFIPFFKYNYSMINLKNNLQELGIVDVFDEVDANLSGMVDLEATDNNAFIMDALHQADIDFSNNGIKAAAATAVVGGLGGAGGGFDYLWEVPVEEINLTFDKPFLFLIRDKSSGEIWFTGAVYDI